MTDDLKHQFEQLVADPPPPSGVPSEAVFARVRSVRRRRTAGVVTLAAAAVVAVAVAAGNLTDINSSPPVTGTPGAPTTVVTGPPTASPTTPASPTTTPDTKTGSTPATTAGPTVGSSPGKGTTTGAGTTTGTGTTTTPPAQPPIDVDVKLTPSINGRTVTMDVTVSGTVLRPTTSEGTALPADTSFLNLSGGTNYTWGDGKDPGGSDGGAVTCEYSKKRTTGRETYPIDSHTYTKPGTYTFHYTVEYCGTDGPFETTKTIKLVIK
ncbi:hypothetical protein EV652_102517 [Kribbella steppae]|uniref:Uncharacterized protein n=1 Tax=Kribbella steppae TaxID=2512223 RepID=A0A4R2HSW0_9ACTN|nr:hypothetical protein [Kribbella steppae]TCO34451.1 hypothetical protein EV652_102517 [Kribbella steppae]